MGEKASGLAGTICVLHVDDDPDFADMAATFVEREDERFDIETATSASEGRDRLSSDAFDCIVSDHDMPGQNGIEFLEAVREEYPSLPFILYTGKGSETVASDAISAGVTDYLQKESGTSQYEVLAHRISNAVETHRSRRAVEEVEEKLSQIAEKTDDILFMFDSEWSELLFINSAYEEVWNGSIDELEANPRSFLKNVHPEDQDVAEQTLKRILEGNPTEVEHRLKDEEGVRWIYSEANPVYDDDGNFTRIVGFVRDITEWKERERETEQRRHRLEQILKTVPACVVQIDTDGQFVFANDRAEEVLGLEPAEVTSRTYNDPEWSITDLDGDPIPDEKLPFRQVRDTEEPISGFSHTIEWPDGTRKVLLVNGAPLFDEEGDIESTVFALTDITDRIQRTRELERQNERFQYVETVADIGYWEIDPQTPKPHDVTLSDGVYHVHDISPEESFDVEKGLQFYHPEDRPQVQQAVERAVTEGEPYDHEVRLITATGRERWVHSVGEPVEEDDEIIRVRGVFQDVTERKTKERELSHQNERLEEFTSIVSHDLKNPLSVAEGNLELARNDCESEHLTAAIDAIERGQELIDDLLTLAREGNEVTEITPVALGELIEDAWQSIQTRDATIVIDTEQTIQADRGRLQQLLENLLRNAVEHGRDDVTITIGDVGNGFYVADDDSGIPEEERDEIFDPGHSTKDGGTGFGLAIVSEIVTTHDWEIRVTDSDAGGARFEITGVESA